MQPDSDAARLWDMLEAARMAIRFVSGRSLEEYAGDQMLKAAVERKIEIIGEAARLVSDAVRDAHPEIPWRKIMAQRHVVAHEYGDIDDALIWRVVTIHVPELIAALEKFAPSADPGAP